MQVVLIQQTSAYTQLLHIIDSNRTLIMPRNICSSPQIGILPLIHVMQCNLLIQIPDDRGIRDRWKPYL